MGQRGGPVAGERLGADCRRDASRSAARGEGAYPQLYVRWDAPALQPPVRRPLRFRRQGSAGSRARTDRRDDLANGGVEADLIGRFYAALPRSPLNQWEERDAKLKTIGHAEECVAFATARGIMTLTANQRAQRAAGVKLLMRLLAEVRRRDLGAVRAMSLQTYQQLVSDTCHAQHGLTLTGRS
jgi:hypothetical protein